ncbi:hypothetical protein [Pseudomonas sp. Marseille-P9899]|uniref:hypothetical protein n=1 Tax=Pseudomonas sp. Marseille-P9899 TaxID=2730401 RepID=UPI00158F0714|nr:hypothetical protein [Pseudomonas sp. Marseille-P9899]
MSDKYAVVLEPGLVLPERGLMVSQAWGDLPVSYFQDQEVFNDCSFLDLKVNKWECNSLWGSKQEVEPWVRIEIFRGPALSEYLQNEGSFLFEEFSGGALIVLELDEDGSEIDEVLLLRLVSVFLGRFKVYKWSESIREISVDMIASIPAKYTVRERLFKCV